jgi:hypothetical protein
MCGRIFYTDESAGQSTNSTRKRLEATEMWFLRRILKISWTEKISNQEMLEMANTERSLIKTMRIRQMRFMGHVYRKGGIEQLRMTGKIGGRRSRGRQQEKYMDSLNMWATSKDINKYEFINASNNLDGWRAMSVNACSRQHTP